MPPKDSATDMTASPGSTTATAPAWPPDARERGDFYHPPRAFPEAIRAWRDELVRRVETDAATFPRARGWSRERVREEVDEGTAKIRDINRILELVHGTPTLGNKSDPVDELVYIILSRKTREDAYVSTYNALKQRFSRWEELLGARRSIIERIVATGGLGDKKTDSLFGALERVRERFGACTLEACESWSDEDVESFLCSLPEVSRKTAYCVMMYAMGRHVFPVDTHVGRVLQRIGIYEELGFSLVGLDHKQLQDSLADAIPPNVRRSLHINLVVHGREFCRASEPRCGDCELRNFCADFRQRETARITSSGAPVFIDLFSGGGGMSEGFCRAGFRPAAALDVDRVALKTLWLNHPALSREGVLVRDVREVDPAELRKLLGRRKLDVMTGAPPCQGFSAAGFRSKSSRTGYRTVQDDRNFLFEYLVDLALILRPRLFLMENVPGMRTAKRDDVSFLDAAARRLKREGQYETAIWKLNATAFGVPQDRTRCFLVASLDALPIAPRGEYRDLRRPGDMDALPPIVLDEALLGLPEVRAGTGTAVQRRDATPSAAEDRRYRRYLSKFKLLSGSPLIFNHFARYNNERDLELYSLLRPGEDSVHAVERHGRADLMRYRRDVFDDKYARLRGDMPCKTIVSHLAKDGNAYIHPREVRNITVREAARVQSFRDDYAFCGSPTDQWVQLGNAVPPLMSEAIARTFLRALKDASR